MPIWEYKVSRLSGVSDQQAALNALGQDRWELVSVALEGGEQRAYLKREGFLPPSVREIAGDAVAVSQPEAKPSKVGTHATVRVLAMDNPAVDGWLDSGLELDDECAGFSVSVDGEVLASSGERVGPEGSQQQTATNPAIGEDLPKGCLVAMIGEEGTPEPVFYSGFLASAEKGRIFFAVNDDSYESNDGEFTIILTVL